MKTKKAKKYLKKQIKTLDKKYHSGKLTSDERSDALGQQLDARRALEDLDALPKTQIGLLKDIIEEMDKRWTSEFRLFKQATSQPESDYLKGKTDALQELEEWMINTYKIKENDIPKIGGDTSST